MHRFFVPALDPADDVVTFPRDEAEHATRVLRLSGGDQVSVFDGRGSEFLARIVTSVRRDVRAQLLSRIEPAAEPTVSVTLAQAVLKGDKMDDVVRDAVMLGVSAIQPIVAKRTEMTIAALIRAQRVERWSRVALASVKQSRRAVLPEVRLPLTFDDWLDEPRAALTMMLVEPATSAGTGSNGSESLAIARDQPRPPDATVVVGPEGGWADEERRLAVERGLRLVTVGPRTLRADAVPIAVLSVLQFLWEDF